MGSIRPLIAYLSTSTRSAVESFGLVRLNRSSNLQRNLSKIFAKPRRENARVHLIQHLVEQNAAIDLGTTSIGTTLAVPRAPSELISPVGEPPTLFMRFLFPVTCVASAPRVACTRSEAVQPSQLDLFEAGLTTKQPDHGTGAAAKQLVVLPGKRKVYRERLRRLKCVQPVATKELLRMTPMISRTPPYHHSSDLLLLRTGTD